LLLASILDCISPVAKLASLVTVAVATRSDDDSVSLLLLLLPLLLRSPSRPAVFNPPRPAKRIALLFCPLPARVVSLSARRSAIENRRSSVRVPRVPRRLSRRSGFRINLRPAKFNLYCPALYSSGSSSRSAVAGGSRSRQIHADILPSDPLGGSRLPLPPLVQIDSGDGKYGINYRWLNFRFSTF